MVKLDGGGETSKEALPQTDIIVPTYTNHNGYRMPMGFPVEGFQSALQYVAQPNDLFVATYPKCGTTWIQHIVYLILHRGTPLQEHQKVDQAFPHLEEVRADYCQNLPPTRSGAPNGEGYRLIKTHLYYSTTPQHPRAKCICVVRNPKDVVVSFFHHTRGFERHYQFANGLFDVYFDLFCKGQVDFGDYFLHLRSWLDHRHDENVLFLTYERMRANPTDTVLQVANFLDPIGSHYVKELQADHGAILNQVLEYSSLQQMQLHPQRWSSTRPEKHPPFVRKGSVGGWEELLQPHQAELLDRRLEEICSEEELNFLGEKYRS